MLRGRKSESAGGEAPQKGSFPLDHFNECQDKTRAYLACLRSHPKTAQEDCRALTVAYLACRMEKYVIFHFHLRLYLSDDLFSSSSRSVKQKNRGLMSEEDVNRLGIALPQQHQKEHQKEHQIEHQNEKGSKSEE